MTLDEYRAAMQSLIVREHEEYIAEIQSKADEAAAKGDEWTARWHQDDVERLKAMKYPWEREAAA